MTRICQQCPGFIPHYSKRMNRSRTHHVLFIALGFLLAFGGSAVAESPAGMISSFRLQHGESKVKADTTLSRIAHEQAAAMAASDVLDHSVLRPFSSRVESSGSRRTAENIAYGYDNFPKTLDQWIASSGHRSNLLMHGATRVGVASARSAKTGRTYWAMVIGDEPVKKTKQTGSKRTKASDDDSCPITISSGLCIY